MRSAVRERPGHILVVEDDTALAESIRAVLERGRHVVDVANTGEAGWAFLETRIPDLVLLDLHLPDRNGLEMLPEIKALGEGISVIVITGDKDVATIVKAMKCGADQFLAKPFDMKSLLEDVDRTLGDHRIKRRTLVYQDRVVGAAADNVLPDLVGSCEQIQNVRELVSQVAGTDASVVLLGETGTGKGMIARGVHRASSRAAGSFVEINCASIQPQLLESEIFGHEKGAFTGAATRKPGLMEVADGGTLFLDEIAEMEHPAQSKLLTALENRSFRRVGGVKDVSVDVRIVAATHHDLEKDVAAGKFRADLFYRLDVFQIHLPPLRDRLSDLPELCQHFMRVLNPVLGKQLTGVSKRAQDLLASYTWPGNVRELRNVIERAMILARGGELEPEHLPANLTGPAAAGAASQPSLAEVEARHIAKVLEVTGFNILRAAEILGISRSTLYTKMDQLGLKKPSS